MDFIIKALRQLFGPSTLFHSGYLAFGMLLSQLAHIYVYQRKGGIELATWFSQFDVCKPMPVVLGAQMAFVFSIFLFFCFQIVFPIVAKLSLS